MKLLNQASIVMMVCNEEYWIELALKPVLELDLPLYIADCASTDKTPDIIKSTVSSYSDVYYERYKSLTPTENGMIRAHLAQKCQTPWILQIDGDELWSKDKLIEVLNTEIPDDIDTGFVHVHNIIYDKGFVLADGISQHRLHRRDAHWHGEYPFESTSDFNGKKFYFPNGPHAYHTRYLARSSRDAETFMRREKQSYFDPQARALNEPIDLFGKVGIPTNYNPYKESKE